jgi:tRNA nucleotidyltransferase (CCA-adding enzyme)
MRTLNLLLPQLGIWKQIHEASLGIRTQTKQYEKNPKDYLVGGAVRDLLLKEAPTDFDIEVFGLSYERLGTVVKKAFPTATITSLPEFGSWHIRQVGATISYSLPRTETKMRPGHRGFVFILDPNLTKKIACSRRDFTVNSLMVDVQTGDMFDYYTGVQDLKHRILQAVNIRTLSQDPLRAWRAVGLISRFNLKPEPQTEETLQRMGHQVEMLGLSGPKVKDELAKLLTSQHPSLGLRKALSWGLIESNLPELYTALRTHKTKKQFLESLDKETQASKRWQLILKTIASQSRQSFVSRLQISKKWLAVSA